MNDFIGFCKLEQILYVLSLGGRSEEKIQPLVGCIFSEDPATMAQLYVLVRGCVLYNSTVYVLEIHPLKKKIQKSFQS